jgi:hypothetical protein
MSMQIFIPLMKVDEARREVWGRATQEVVDKSGEILDYESSKPYFKAWSDEIAKATDGKSLGNIRAMHGKVAAGKVIHIDFNDAEKAIDLGTKIVDDQEWQKVLEGVYTGFSIGGSYVKKWKDGDAMRFTASPSETSLVDNPCVPTAKFFEVLKADGALAKVAFREPVDGAVEKGLYQVGWAADLLASVNALQECISTESAVEGDGSAVPAKLKAVVSAFAAALVTLVQEEASELMQGEDIDVLPDGSLAMASKSPLRKIGARNSKADKEHLQAIHDHATAMGADCPAGGDASEKLAKAAEAEALVKAALDAALAKVAAAEAETALAKAEAEKLAKRVAELEAQPEAPKGALKVVDKAADTTLAAETAKEEEIRKAAESGDPLALMKVTLKHGGQPIR